MTRAAHVQLDLSALRHNVRSIKKYAPNSRILAMVKANAYGHSLEHIAPALQSVDALGVACLEEASQLRYLGVSHPIVLMEGFFNAAELKPIVALQLEVVIHHEEQLKILEQHTLTTPLTVWLKIDTGMHRLGFNPQQVLQVWQRLVECRSVKSPPRLMTHFAQADARQQTATQLQSDLFMQTIAKLPGERSLANSAGILAWPNTHADWVRPGIALYGVSPFAEHVGSDFGLQPVMTVQSEIIAIHQLHKGDAVGYGAEWVCQQDTLVGIVAIGYGDGYPHHAKNGTPVLVNGQRVPLIGRVSMDMLAVNLNEQPAAKIGDSVILWGAGLPVEEVARHADSLSYELLCGIAQRLKVRMRIKDN